MPEPEADEAYQTEERIEFQFPVKLSPEKYEALIGERIVLLDKPSIAILPFLISNESQPS